MLTREAFNALLKTLEEPPSHAIFILATTEIHKVLPTIISRCQRFDFHKLTLDKIVERLGEIAKNEGVKVEKTALELIAANADGAARDAESLLGQVMAMEDKDITLKEAQEILGTTSISTTIEMANLIIRKDLGGALGYINKVVNDGYDMSQFAKSLVSYFRKMMILASFKEGANEIATMKKLVAPELTSEQFDGMLEQGKKFTGADLIKIIKLFARAEQEVKSSVLPQMPLELAVAEIIGEINLLCKTSKTR
jgi:DNA polymerase-3 subunit gamma/tau